MVERVDVATGRVKARLRKVASRDGECMVDARCVLSRKTEMVSERVIIAKLRRLKRAAVHSRRCGSKAAQSNWRKDLARNGRNKEI